MLSSPRLIAPLVVIALAAAASGCSSSSDSSTPTLSGPTPAVVTETFTGTISQNDSSIFSFSVTNSGYPLLAAFTSITPASVTALGLGIGNWDPSSSTCGLNMSQNDTSHSGSTAVSATASSGAYCIRVYDGGNIGSNVTASFTVQVQHY